MIGIAHGGKQKKKKKKFFNWTKFHEDWGSREIPLRNFDWKFKVKYASILKFYIKLFCSHFTLGTWLYQQYETFCMKVCTRTCIKQYKNSTRNQQRHHYTECEKSISIFLSLLFVRSFTSVFQFSLKYCHIIKFNILLI